MNIDQCVFLLLVFLLAISHAFPMPENNEEVEDRRHHRRRPCKRPPSGKTFFDWSVLLVDINQNQNYNYNCGGGASNGGLFGGGGGHGGHGGGLFGNRPGNGNNGHLGLFGNNGFFNIRQWLNGLFQLNQSPNYAINNNNNVKPVYEDVDDISDPSSFIKPGQYFGQLQKPFTSIFNNFNPNKITRPNRLGARPFHPYGIRNK